MALDLPTTIVSACPDEAAAEYVQDVFSNTCMRVYTNADIKGVELSGALKNVIALGVGISTGLGYGDNARAASSPAALPKSPGWAWPWAATSTPLRVWPVSAT